MSPTATARLSATSGRATSSFQSESPSAVGKMEARAIQTNNKRDAVLPTPRRRVATLVIQKPTLGLLERLSRFKPAASAADS
jgi:hypothetical protein